MTLEERLEKAEQELAAIKKEMTPKQEDRFVPHIGDYWVNYKFSGRKAFIKLEIEYIPRVAGIIEWH